MDGVNYIYWLFTAAAIGNVVLGQTVKGPVDTTVESGTTAQLVCNVTGDSQPALFIWVDSSTGVVIFNAGRKQNPDVDFPKYTNFDIEESTDATGGTSKVIISNTEVEDAGPYRCEITGLTNPPAATVFVQVRSTVTVTISSPLREGEQATAQCDAVGGRPQETLTWYINNVEQTTGVEESNPPDPSQPGLTNTRSILTFNPTAANNGQILSCRVTGHTLTDLNQRMDTTLDVQARAPPASGSIDVTIVDRGTSLLVTCIIIANPPPHPEIDTYSIYRDGDIISNSNTANVSPVPESCTNFTCTASNELGNTTATPPEYCPGAGTTTPPPTTAAPTAPNPGDGDNDTGASTAPGPSIGAIAGGVGGVVVLCIICILVWYFCCKRGDCGGACTCCPDVDWCPDGNCCPCCESDDPPKPVGGGSGGGKDNRVSGVATYNTSDPEKAPVAKPRSTIQHDTNNPGGDMYAMVDKGGRGDRDYPDAGRNGKGQPTDPQLTYADLDLSARKEVHIPKDEKEVVVYSSIVV